MKVNSLNTFILFLFLFSHESFCFFVPENMNIIDLSYPLNNNTLHWITTRPFEMSVVFNGSKLVNQHSIWLQTEEVAFNSHTGTHLDSPCHFAYGAWCVTDIPIEHFVDRPAVVIDVMKSCSRNRDYEVTIEDLVQFESLYGRIPDGAVLMIKTGHSRYWPIKEQYFGSESNDPNQLHFPGIHSTTARWIVQYRNIVGVGIEGPSVDGGQSHTFSTHTTLAEKNIFNIENLPNLHKMPPIGATVTLLPLKVEKASGAPVRIIANLNPGGSRSSSHVRFVVSSFFGLLLSSLSLQLCLRCSL